LTCSKSHNQNLKISVATVKYSVATATYWPRFAHPCCRKLVLRRCLETDQPVPLHLHEASTLLPHSSVTHSKYNNCYTHSRWEGKCFISLKALQLSAYNDSSFFFPSLTFSASHFRYKGLLLHFITLNGTHAYSVGLPCTRDRPIAEVST
jgi:hypothetical protein